MGREAPPLSRDTKRNCPEPANTVRLIKKAQIKL